MNLELPEMAIRFYQSNERYRSQNNKLGKMIKMYNSVIINLLSVEEPLVLWQIQQIDSLLEAGISTIVWSDSNIEEFIQRIFSEVETLFKTVFKMKDDLQRVQSTLDEFNVRIFPSKVKSVSPEEFY